MTIDTKHLESLLERVTPGDFRQERFLVYALDEAEIQNRFSASVQRGVVRAQWRSGTRENTTDEELLANAELMSMSKTLARRVIAAEKLAGALRDLLSYIAHDETPDWVLQPALRALSEWDNVK